ncbi:MAG: DUF4157 domain-containing protein [Anaerolineae bacterium]|nr:DUF4157 domain-containing protein [Anaerolineae bacterium]
MEGKMAAQRQAVQPTRVQPSSAVSGLQPRCACGSPTLMGGECAACRKKRGDRLQRAAAHARPLGDVPPIVYEVLHSPGQPLDPSARRSMESHFDHDFRHVRVHTNAKAVESAAAVNALAYTVGHDVVFGAGQYRPHDTSGQRILAHELAHVVQQRQLPPAGMLHHSENQSHLEREAEAASEQVSSEGRTSALSDAPRGSLQRQGTGAAAPVCARPINWVHGPGAADHGADAIQINITWQSSTGNLADLSNCQVREVVNYDPIPNPPFIWNPPNPTILTVAGTAGAGQDTHSYPPGLKTGITNPRTDGTAVAHQVYQWRCTGTGCSGSWTDFPGESYDITREVFPEFVRLNPWRYRVTKQGTGTGNTFNYSRDVEIPEP